MSTRQVARTVVILVALVVIGTFSLAHLPQTHLTHLFPTGLACAFLVTGVRPRWWPLTSAVVGLFAIAVLLADGHVWSLQTATAGMGISVGVLVGAWLIPRQSGKPVLLTHAHLGRFLLASLVASVAATVVTTIGFWDQSPSRVVTVAAICFMVTFASMLLMVPPVMQSPAPVASGVTVEAMVQWAVLIVTLATLMMAADRLPMLMVVVFPIVGWGAMRGTMRSIQAQLLVVAVCLCASTLLGFGPFHTMRFGSGYRIESVLTLGLLIAVSLALTALPATLSVALQRHHRRDAQVEAERLQGIVSSAQGVAIVGSDATGRIDLFNPTAERFLGYTAKEMLGRSPRIFFSYEEIMRIASTLRVSPTFTHVARALATSDKVLECQLTRKDGSLRTCNLTLSPSRDTQGRVSGYVSTFEDVTERVAVQHALEEALEAERHALEQQREIDTVKDIFVSSVSHELRTPITSMLGYLEVLEDGSFGVLNTEQMAALTKVINNSNRLLTLIDDLLTLSRLEEPNPYEVVLTDLDLRDIVNTAAAVMGPAAQASRLELTSDVPAEQVRFLGDREQLERVVVNLLSNAVKFSRPGGRVEVVLRHSMSAAVIRVRDNGLGIPASEQPRIFTRFFRSSVARDQAIQGSGLGLAITNALVATYGGSIEFDSVEGVGTEFRIVLPVLPRQRSGPVSSAERHRDEAVKEVRESAERRRN